MALTKSTAVLVLGATGPAGICLVRELLYRQYKTVVYARNPAKIPQELSANPLLTIIKGEMNDHESLFKAVSLASIVISLLGPNIADKGISPTLYPDYYEKDIFPLMRKAGVKRILAMGTISIARPEDQWNFFHLIVRGFMKFLSGNIYQNMVNLAALFDGKAEGLDWTVFRIAQIPGGSEEPDWERERDDGTVFAGPVGAKGWTSSIKRAALAKWLVDNMESSQWVRTMPALGRQG